MTDRSQRSLFNRLLRNLPPETWERLRSFLRLIDLPSKTELVGSDKPTNYAYFLESGIASIVGGAGHRKRDLLETGQFGREGMSACHLLMMCDTTDRRTFMQVGGQGFAIETAPLVALVDSDADLRGFLLRYASTCWSQTAETVASSRLHLRQRLARWLLMCDDRQAFSFAITHDGIAASLGVRRPGITNELHLLEGTHAVRSTRSLVEITDRAQLLSIAGDCYGGPEREYDRIMRYRSAPASISRGTQAAFKQDRLPVLASG